MTRKFHNCLSEEAVSYNSTFLTTWNVESIHGVVTRMMTKQRARLFSITKGDLRPRLAKLYSKFATSNFFRLVMAQVLRHCYGMGSQMARKQPMAFFKQATILPTYLYPKAD